MKRDMSFSDLRRKAEGMGYAWDGTAFTHSQLRLRVVPITKRDFGAGGSAGINARETFARLVDRYNENKGLAA